MSSGLLVRYDRRAEIHEAFLRARLLPRLLQKAAELILIQVSSASTVRTREVAGSKPAVPIASPRRAHGVVVESSVAIGAFAPGTRGPCRLRAGSGDGA